MKERILIVEDEEIIAMDLRASLERLGYEVIDNVVAGEMALEILKKRQPDLILMDIFLAGELSGIDTTQIIREKYDIPVVYLTSYSDEDTLKKAKETNPAAFLLKPFNKDKIRTTIEMCLHKHKGEKKEREEKLLLVENIQELEGRKKKLEKEASMITMQIQDLNETTKHLAAAAFREREEKNKITAEKEVLEKEKAMVKMQIDDLAETNKLLAETTFRERQKKEEYFNELQDKNKKITASINYAKRIQNAIVPDDDQMKAALGDYFSLYLPKDIVCGDFPWLFHKPPYVYVAAVDCTGHGVPGAMMSLIGYLLLNDIVNNPGQVTPSEILVQLDKAVVQTLKQDRGGAEARDGMDVAIARINTETMHVDYSGAHRPLYYMHKGELCQLKGDRKAIGGTFSKKKDIPFTNSTIQLQKGDSFYLFSDGFPDQFGGPDDLKYGPRRIRELIANNGNLTMGEMQRLFEEEFYQWKGNGKQMDDILMMGIKF